MDHRQEYLKRYYQEHKEKVKARFQAKREHFRAYAKKYYSENKWRWKELYAPRQIVKDAEKIKKSEKK